MNQTRRAHRMEVRAMNKNRVGSLNLVSLMDIFTILVFFLLAQSAAVEVLPNAENLELPESLARMRRQTNAGVIGPSRAGSLSVAHLPLPALRGIVTVWGRVVQGMAVIDRLDETDAVDSVDVTGWDLAPFLAAHSDSE